MSRKLSRLERTRRQKHDLKIQWQALEAAAKGLKSSPHLLDTHEQALAIALDSKCFKHAGDCIGTAEYVFSLCGTDMLFTWGY